MTSPTSHGIACGAYRTPPRMVRTRENVATASASHCAGPLLAVVSDRDGRQLKHQVRKDGAGDTAEALDDDIRDHVAPDAFAEGKDERHGRVEMGDRYGRKDRDEHDEDGAGRDSIAEKRDGLITAASRSAMMPEPTTVATRIAVPSPSARSRR